MCVVGGMPRAPCFPTLATEVCGHVRQGTEVCFATFANRGLRPTAVLPGRPSSASPRLLSAPPARRFSPRFQIKVTASPHIKGRAFSRRYRTPLRRRRLAMDARLHPGCVRGVCCLLEMHMHPRNTVLVMKRRPHRCRAPGGWREIEKRRVSPAALATLRLHARAD